MTLKDNGMICDELEKVRRSMVDDELLAHVTEQDKVGLRVWHYGAAWPKHEANEIPIPRIKAFMTRYLKRFSFSDEKQVK